MSSLRKLAGETAVYGVSSILGRLLNLLLVPLYTNVFSEAEYGRVSAFYAASAILIVALTFGMETAFFRYAEDSEDPMPAYRRAFSWVLACCAAFLLPGLLLYKSIAAGIGYGEQSELTLMLVLIIAMDALAALPMARLRREGKAMRFMWISLSNIGLTMALNLFFILALHKGIEYIFVANIIASAIRLGMALPGNWPGGLLWDWAQLRPMAQYGLFIMLAGLAGSMNEMLSRLLIPNLWPDGALFQGKARSGEELNGIFAACYKLSMFIALATQAFRYAAEPFFFRQAKDKQSPHTFARVFHYYSLFCLTAFLLVSSFAYEIAAFDFFGIFGKGRSFIGPRFWEALNVVPVLLMAYVFSAAYLQISIWFKITKQTRFAMLFTGIGVLITVTINLLTIPRWGYVGSAWATFVCYGAMCALAYIAGQRYYPIPYNLRRLAAYTLLCVAGYALAWRIGPSAGEAWVFLSKTGLCLFVLALIAAWEYRFPTRFQAESAPR